LELEADTAKNCAAEFDYLQEKGVNLVEQYYLKEAHDVANTIFYLPLYPDLGIPIVEDIIHIIARLTTP